MSFTLIMEIQATSGGKSNSGYLDGQLLVAMPQMRDQRFARSVVYLCAHSEDGAMGLILNKSATDITFHDLLERLEIQHEETERNSLDELQEVTIRSGGPVETGRGFVLHSPDYFIADTTFSIDGDICLTATIDILKSLAIGKGPDHAILALGYAGWSAGQLEGEIQANGWLHSPAPPELVFSGDLKGMYDNALAQIGVNPSQLVSQAGHA